MDSQLPTGANSSEIKLAFASCSVDLIDQFVEEVQSMGGLDLPVYMVAEFKPKAECHWIPWHPFESLALNRQRILWHIAGKSIRFNCILLQPRQPYLNMRWLAFTIAPAKVYFFNENYGHFPFHLRGIPQSFRHLIWRTKNFIRQQTRAGGRFYTLLWRLKHPFSLERPAYAQLARWRGALSTKALRSEALPVLEPGITVVIPSREGRKLLETLLPQIKEGLVRKIIIVDNGSSDNTQDFASEFIEVIRVDHALSFAAAVNLGIRASRSTHTCLLNNDMVLEADFFSALERAFQVIPDLFCATAQIFFPDGKRREETGKAAYQPTAVRDFPLRCETPVDGENYSPVLYGSGGCSLYDTAKLLSIGCFKEAFRPAYVEDLDTGWRGWQQNWPSVFVADAKVIHFHRSTTARFFAASSIELAIEQNYLRWILSSVATPAVFDRLWQQAVTRLNFLAAVPEPAPIATFALRFAAFEKPYFDWDRPAEPKLDEMQILAFGCGAISCFPGAATQNKTRILISTAYLPFPLSHGGAVRMYNLMREAAKDYTLILLSFVDEFERPAQELLDLCAEIIEVKREGTHYRRSTVNPKVVEEFQSDAYSAAIQWVHRRWQPEIVQLEFTQMGQYAAACKPAKTILVEHDITLDLYGQLLKDKEDFDMRLELQRWQSFEHAAWREVDCVAVMSSRDEQMITEAKRIAIIENGVDLARFNPSALEPEKGRLLFIGSLAHLPNLMALAWFLKEVWPRLENTKLHIIAGRDPDYYIDFYKERVQLNLKQAGIEIEAFVSDVRPAYERAEIVIAPLLASAGTNIKIMEAMACGKAIVSTPGGVNGLSIAADQDYLAAETGEEFARAIGQIQTNSTLRRQLERQARTSAESRYSWTAIGEKQRKLYESLRANAE